MQWLKGGARQQQAQQSIVICNSFPLPLHFLAAHLRERCLPITFHMPFLPTSNRGGKRTAGAKGTKKAAVLCSHPAMPGSVGGKEPDS